MEKKPRSEAIGCYECEHLQGNYCIAKKIGINNKRMKVCEGEDKFNEV